MISTLRSLGSLLFLSVLISGCATYQTGLKTGGEVAAGGAGSYEEAYADWSANRGTKEGLQGTLDKLEAVLAAAPENQDALILLARSYYFMADGYTDDAEAKNVLFEKGVTLGERAMAADPAFKAQIDKGVKPADAVTALQKDDQMAIYWTASSLGKWARGKGFSTIVKYKGYIAKMMTHCLELDETAYHGGPPRYWGAFYSIAPSFAGGDMDKSKEMYERALKLSPNNFATYVLYADSYARKVQDRALFERLLKTVIDGDPASLPGMEPEQAVEQRKAAAFLKNIDEYFAE